MSKVWKIQLWIPSKIPVELPHTIFLTVISTRSLMPSSGSSSVSCLIRLFFNMWNISSREMKPSPFKSYTSKQSGHRNKTTRVIRVITLFYYPWKYACILHLIFSAKVPRRKTDSPSVHSLTLTKLSLSLSNARKTIRKHKPQLTVFYQSHSRYLWTQWFAFNLRYFCSC